MKIQSDKNTGVKTLMFSDKLTSICPFRNNVLKPVSIVGQTQIIPAPQPCDSTCPFFMENGIVVSLHCVPAPISITLEE